MIQKDAPTRPRPLSPHLQIYAPQLTSVTSIFHRLSGMALVVGLMALTVILAAAASGPEAYASVMTVAMHPASLIAWVGWTAAIYYHLLCGIRHMIFDTGLLFKIDHAERAGQVILIGAAFLTIGTWATLLM